MYLSISIPMIDSQDRELNIKKEKNSQLDMSIRKLWFNIWSPNHMIQGQMPLKWPLWSIPVCIYLYDQNCIDQHFTESSYSKYCLSSHLDLNPYAGGG